MLQMVIKYTNTFHSKGLQNLPKLGIRDWKKPSGNPGLLPSNLDFFLLRKLFTRSQISHQKKINKKRIYLLSRNTVSIYIRKSTGEKIDADWRKFCIT
jgi:hypothetical protein